MQRTIAAILLYLGLATAALAQQVVNPMPNAGIYGAYNSAAPTCVSGTGCWIQTDINGNLKVAASGSGTTAQQVQGNSASGVADVGNPVKVGGKYSSTLPTYTDGQRGDLQLSPRGVLLASPYVSTTAVDGNVNSAMGLVFGSTGSSSLPLVGPVNFNSTTWDRQFTCPNSAVVNVTAGSTTQIVALAASQVIRVCSFAVSMSAAGTAAFVYGTGSNCGTGTTSITGAMTLATGTPMAMSAGGNSVFRTAAANALCVTAVTGNVTGFVSYAQY